MIDKYIPRLQHTYLYWFLCPRGIMFTLLCNCFVSFQQTDGLTVTFYFIFKFNVLRMTGFKVESVRRQDSDELEIRQPLLPYRNSSTTKTLTLWKVTSIQIHINKKAGLPQKNRAMLQLFFSVSPTTFTTILRIAKLRKPGFRDPNIPAHNRT